MPGKPGGEARKGALTIATFYDEKKNELQRHIDKLKEILFSTQVNNP
ncbi:MAG: hypothetical protein ACXWCG_02250 [Flavitalea sp.]